MLGVAFFLQDYYANPLGTALLLTDPMRRVTIALVARQLHNKKRLCLRVSAGSSEITHGCDTNALAVRAYLAIVVLKEVEHFN